MKVIGAGFGRTGTTSLKAALEHLGMPCYHMVEVFAHLDHVATWRDANAGRPVSWPAVFASYEAAVDWPSCTFYKQQMLAYPDAKVILSVRDPEKWHRSAMDTIFAVGKVLPPWLRCNMPRMGPMNRMVDEIIWEGTFGGRFPDKAHAIAVYQQHIEDVKRHVPPERLLVFDVKEGWAPLCAFLGVPVPTMPFPHLNDTAEFQKIIGRLRAAWIVVRILAVAAIVFPLALLAWRLLS